MSARDVFQAINEMDSDTVQVIVDRLEFRGSDPSFVRMREAYLQRIKLEPNSRVLEIGCGTGVVSRAIARRNGFTGTVVASDFSDALITAARGLASKEGLGERVDFRVGDSHALEEPDDSYDVVIAHTLVSHVSDPKAVVLEAERVLRPDGVLVIFDGDYASLAFGAGTPELNDDLVTAILAAVVANPHVMRSIPLLLEGAGLEIKSFLPEVHAEAGAASFFANLAESYAPMAARAGVVSAEKAEQWLAVQREASHKRTFFGACNYYSYIAGRSG